MGGPRWSRSRRSLSAQLLVGQVGVLLVAGLVGFVLWAHAARAELDRQYQQRALAIAEAAASTPQIGAALASRDPAGVQGLAQALTRSTGASYIVVIDRDGVRYSHPNVALIGRTVEEPVIALDGADHMGFDPGSLGRSANAKAPVRAPGAVVVGEVSVGVVETTIALQAGTQLLTLAIYLGVAIAVGVAVAFLLARRLKRQTFGLELDEIAGLLTEREATLHGIREGVVAIDPNGHLSLINDHAHHLIGTSPSALGRRVLEVLPEGELRDLVREPGDVADRLVPLGGRFLVASRMRVRHGNRDLGAVVTLRDRTELESVLRELDDVRGLTDALRAQQHEFANRIHVISGLLEMRDYDEAIRYAVQIDVEDHRLAAQLEASITNPRLIALLLAKATVARERGVIMSVHPESRVTIDDATADALVLILGNLIDNAIDAATQTSTPETTTHSSATSVNSPARPSAEVAEVSVRLAQGVREVSIEVADSGPGIAASVRSSIFEGGWSTKPDTAGRVRGLGLALVRQLVDQMGGSVEVTEGPGARFRVGIPSARAGARP